MVRFLAVFLSRFAPGYCGEGFWWRFQAAPLWTLHGCRHWPCTIEGDKAPGHWHWAVVVDNRITQTAGTLQILRANFAELDAQYGGYDPPWHPPSCMIHCLWKVLSCSIPWEADVQEEDHQEDESEAVPSVIWGRAEAVIAGVESSHFLEAFCEVCELQPHHAHKIPGKEWVMCKESVWIVVDLSLL